VCAVGGLIPSLYNDDDSGFHVYGGLIGALAVS
jgi:hypothetical protein